MIINHNIAALNTYRQLSSVNTSSSKSLEKLSSGLRINRAGDDAAGLAISEKMRGQIRGLEQATRNAQDGISMIQTAEGALNETHSILQRMRELAVQSANDSNTSTDRAELQKEVDQLAKELTRIANDTEFNTQTLLNGGVQEGNIGKATYQIGANEGQSLDLEINAMDASSLGVARDVLGATVDTSATSIDSAEVDINASGSSIVDGETITISTADNTGTKATGTLDAGGTTGIITADFGAVGEAANGIKIVFGDDDDTTGTAVWDGANNTVTVTGDWDASGGTAPTLAGLNAAIQGADTSLNNLTLSVDGTYTANELLNVGTITLSGGSDANTAETIVTFTDSASNTQTVTVADTAEEVSVTGGIMEGLSFTTSDVKTAAGGINLATTAATAATFSDGVKTADAMALGGINISTQTNADTAITTINDAIETVSAERSKLGAYQNRLEHTINNLGTSSENLSAAESRVRDVDMAKEMMEFTKNSIISQAATAMLAQANQQPQQVLQLLR